MIDTEERGQEKLRDVTNHWSRYPDDLGEFEYAFIQGLVNKKMTYKQLTPKQKGLVDQIWARYLR